MPYFSEIVFTTFFFRMKKIIKKKLHSLVLYEFNFHNPILLFSCEMSVTVQLYLKIPNISRMNY